MPKTFIKLTVVLAAILAAALFFLWTPDTDWQEMHAKYGSPDSEFIKLPNGVTLHYREFGNEQSKSIVLIHGTSDSLITWDAITPYLQDTYRLISLDLPGHGLSSTHPLTDYSRAAMVETVTQLMDELAISSATLMGNSLGGGIAWRTALQHADRVDSLILLNPSGAPTKTVSKSNLGFRIMRSSIGRYIGKKVTPRVLVKRSLMDTVVDDSIVSSKMADRYWELLRLPGNRQALTELALIKPDHSFWESLSTLDHPALIIWGEEDQLIPVSSGKLFENALPNSHLIVYPKIGHLPMIETPDTVATDVLRFLDNQ